MDIFLHHYLYIRPFSSTNRRTLMNSQCYLPVFFIDFCLLKRLTEIFLSLIVSWPSHAIIKVVRLVSMCWRRVRISKCGLNLHSLNFQHYALHTALSGAIFKSSLILVWNSSFWWILPLSQWRQLEQWNPFHGPNPACILSKYSHIKFRQTELLLPNLLHNIHNI